MSALARIVDVRPSEAPLVLRVFVAFFGIIAGHTVLETARDALFLRALPADRLTLVYLALAALGLVVPAYNTRWVRLFGRRDALVVTLMLAATGTALWYFQSLEGAGLYGVYIWSALIGTVLVVQFWLFAGRVFTVSQGKRLFSGLASGGVLGAVTGALVASSALELLADVRGLLLVAAGLFLASAMSLTWVPTEDFGAPLSKLAGGWSPGWSVLREHPYVRQIALLVALSTVTLLATDYLFKLVAKEAVPAEELGSFFARYYALLNGGALVMQLFIAHRVVRRVGVVAALAVLPLALAVGAAGTAVLSGSLVMVLLTKGADGGLRHSLHRVATELLYLPLPPDVRDRAKSLLEAVFVRGSQALAAGGILLLASLGHGTPTVLAAIVAVCACFWLMVTSALRRGYVDLFRDELGRGVLDPRLLDVGDLDIDSIESIMDALSSPKASRVIAAIDLLVESGRARLVPALILYHDDDEVLVRAIDVVSRNHEQSWRPHAARLARSASPPVRAAALRALGRVCEAELVGRAIHDESPSIRAHAAFQLARCEGGDDPSNHPAVVAVRREALEGDLETSRQLRLGMVEALELDADGRWLELMLWLASDDDPEVIEGTARAIRHVPSELFVPLLIPWLAVRGPREAVREALTAIGGPAFAPLVRALRDGEVPASLRRQLPVTIAHFGTQAAADVLSEQLGLERDGVVRYRVVKALSRIVRHAVRVDRRVIEREIVSNLVEHFRLLGLSTALEGEASATALLLEELLVDKQRQAFERAFRLFKVIHPREDVRGIYAALGASDRHDRARAVEFVDVLSLASEEPLRSLLRLAVDDLPAAARVERARTATNGVPPVPATLEEVLRRLIADADASVVTLAAYHAMAVDALDDELETLLARRPSLLAPPPKERNGG